MYLLLKQLLE